MANRYTDTDKWTKNVWFRKLPPQAKLFWLYLCDNCNHAGIWDVDFDFATTLIGTKIDEVEVLNLFGDRIVRVDDGAKWFLPAFVLYQYRGGLDAKNRAHNSVIKILTKEGVSKGLIRALEGGRDREREGDNPTPEVNACAASDSDAFQAFWELYPRKVGKKKTATLWEANVLDLFAPAIMTGVRVYLECEAWHQGYVENPAKWLTEELWCDQPPKRKDAATKQAPGGTLD